MIRSGSWFPTTATAAVVLFGHVACHGTPSETPVPRQTKESEPTPATDLGSLCADVGPIRACWGAKSDAVPDTVHLVARTLPSPSSGPASPMGWRCAGQGPARGCADRARSAPPFVCAGDVCTQRHPRMPDDGEWICSEMSGAVICAGGQPAAGVAPAPADSAWLCGVRQGGPPGDGAGPRICVDFAPDFPDGNLGSWRCRHINDQPGGRICERRNNGAGALLADPCDHAHPCVDGSTCAAGRCLPRRPAPSCWLDADCPQPRGACRFGTCVGEPTR